MSSYSLLPTLRRLSGTAVRRRVIPGLRHLHRSRLRNCGCCGRFSLIVALDDVGEVQRCIRCGANLRYEFLAEVLRRECPDLSNLDVLELDADSPLRRHLGKARRYVRTYYAPDHRPGNVRADGARCEDVTHLTFPDASFDLVVSSEVLEHLADLPAATSELARVLRSHGRHIFTVPTTDVVTVRRAVNEYGGIRHLAPPEYHGDPAGGKDGILAYWTFGRDAGQWLSAPGLQTEILDERRDLADRLLRVVWQSTRMVVAETDRVTNVGPENDGCG